MKKIILIVVFVLGFYYFFSNTNSNKVVIKKQEIISNVIENNIEDNVSKIKNIVLKREFKFSEKKEKITKNVEINKSIKKDLEEVISIDDTDFFGRKGKCFKFYIY